jgi:hypothetical protein
MLWGVRSSIRVLKSKTYAVSSLASFPAVPYSNWLEDTFMARPIEPTPVLKGRDAKIFIERMDAAVMTPERLRWLESIAAESKRAEDRK